MDDPSKKTPAELIKLVDDLINDIEWGDSAFFNSTRKKLEDFSTQLKEKYDIAGAKTTPTATIANRIAQRSGMVEVYISLYSVAGNDVKAWQPIINSLDGQSVNRPMYKEEKDIIESIKSKQNKINDGYVAIFIRETDIIKKLDEIPLDRMNHELLAVRQGAIDPDNISRFVHVSGQYRYENKTLVREGAAEFL